MKKIILLSSILFCFLNISLAQSGQLDPSFGGRGWVTEEFIKANLNSETILKVLPELNGTNILVIGEVNALARLHTDGTIDSTFGKNGYVLIPHMTIAGAARQNDGKILVSGQYFTGQGNEFTIMRFNSDGSIDSTYSGDGKIINDFPGSITLQNDGKLLVAGSYQNIYSLIARYNTDGSPDASFGANGRIIDNSLQTIYSVVVQTDGRIIGAGYIFVACTDCDPRDGGGGGDVYYLTGYNSDGSIDNSFGSNGKLRINGGFLARQSDDKLILASGGLHLERFNSDGSADNVFYKYAYLPLSDAPSSIAFQSDGKIIVAGITSAFQPNINNNFDLVRYNEDGTVDSTFDGDGVAITDFGSKDFSNSVVVQNDGSILVGGSTEGTHNKDFALAVYNSNGSLDENFSGDGKEIGYVGINYGTLSEIAVESDGKPVVAGRDRDSLNNDRFFISRYNTDGTPDKTFSGDGKQITYFGDSGIVLTSLAIQGDGKIVAGGFVRPPHPSGIDSTYFALARFNYDGSIDSTFSGDGRQTTTFGNKYIYTSIESLVIQYDGKILAGGNVTDGSKSDFIIARYNIDGSLDGTFGNNGVQITDFNNDDALFSLAISNDHKIVAAGNTLFENSQNFAVARYNEDGSPDSTFSDDGKQITVFDSNNSDVRSVAVQSDGKIVAAGDARVGFTTTQKFAIARYNINGSLDSTFDNDGKQTTDFMYPSSAAESVNIQKDGKIVAAGLVDNNTDFFLNDFAIARYNSNGSLDSSFGLNGKVITDLGGNERADASAIYNNTLYVTGTNLIAAYNLDNNNVTISCPASKIVSTDKGKCSAVVNDVDPVLEDNTTPVNYTLSGATRASGSGSVSGKVFNKGITTVTYSLTNDAAKNCSFTITVNDNEAPHVSPIFAFPNILWPANNTMRYVFLFYYNRDNCGSSDCKISVTGNQDISGDWQIVNDHLIKLKAKNTGGKQRIYTITVTCKDAAGNVASHSVAIRVANFRGRNIYVSSNNDASRPYENIVNDFNKFDMKAFPNPSKDHFTLQVLNNNTNEKINVQVYDISGRLMETKTGLPAGKNIVLGSSLKQGTYIAEVRQGLNVQRLKLVKTK